MRRGANVRFLVFKILGKDMIARIVHLPGFEIRTQGAAMLYRQRRRIEHVEDRVGNVDRFGEIVDNALPDASRPAHHERNAHGGIVAAMLLETAVLPETVSVIRHVDDERIVLEIVLLQKVENMADVAVEISRRIVVSRRDAPLLLIGEIPKDQRNLPGILGTDLRGFEAG